MITGSFLLRKGGRNASQGKGALTEEYLNLGKIEGRKVEFWTETRQS